MADMKLGIVVDTDTRPTRQEFSALRRDIKAEADSMGGDWEAAAGKIEQALQDAGARTDLIDAARRIGQDGPTEIEKMRTALRDTGDDARTLGDDVADAAEGIKDSFADNALEADDVFKADLKAELVSNMVETGAEVVRGFKDGFDSEDASTIVDGLTDTMASVGALGGPVGAAAGLAGGALVQMFAGPFLEDAEKTAEQFEGTFSTAFSNIVENGRVMGRELSIAASVDEFAKDTDRMNAATETANKLGVERGIVLRAMAGDTDALNVVTAEAARLNDEQAAAAKRAGDEMLDNGKVSDDTAKEVNDLNQQLSGLDGLLGDVSGSYDTNTDALNAATEAAEAKGEADAFAANKAIENAHAMADSTGKAQELDVTINGVTRSLKVMPGKKEVEVTDDGSAKKTQEKVNNLHGKSLIVPVSADTSNVDAYIRGLSYQRPVLNVDVRHRRVGGPTP